MKKRVVFLATVVFILMVRTPVNSQQKMDPVDFKPFVDGRNWIVREPLTYKIGISQDSITVPVGFVTDLASIPPALQSFIQQNGPYLLQPSSTTTFTGSRHVPVISPTKSCFLR